LPPDETIRAYQTIYFPAQLIHFALDAPREAADTVIDNDPLAAAWSPVRAPSVT
jgi:uridine kinase